MYRLMDMPLFIRNVYYNIYILYRHNYNIKYFEFSYCIYLEFEYEIFKFFKEIYVN